MVTVVDYGIGNLRSLEKALIHVGSPVLRTDLAEDIAAADLLILPGVGAFGACIQAIRQHNLEQPIRDAAQRGVPFLGVCVGMQMLFETGLERGTFPGLGLLPGRVVPFELADRRLKIPHMGWNLITPRYDSALLKGLSDDARCYFVHSFHPTSIREADILATTNYGYDFPSIVARANVFGVQFHPEKSHRVGLRILSNFVALRADS
ncbi:MAG: imidazole glycerol phosphate synthase subunit HisH [Bacteroidota bacterium]|nr:imidazole glycerol phosphate synthase subunit HisH [Bacteroidota bacterium]MDE2834302.1 imidazole glycerol phosphate synthase subunit HisH [Bacteroidota bacterium]MDE2955713.1 imidazole glycerol phosphate synthase subunit HisH [Bacteroidota bacterium]